MARMERETRRYITWLPFLIDSVFWTRRGWRIGEKERIVPASKVLAPLSLLFPIIRVTYERIVAGGMMPPLPGYPPGPPIYPIMLDPETGKVIPPGVPFPPSLPSLPPLTPKSPQEDA